MGIPFRENCRWEHALKLKLEPLVPAGSATASVRRRYASSNVPSIDSLLLEFTELYGTATFDGFTLLNSHDPQRVAVWIYGDETLSLSTIVLDNEHPAATAVLVQLWKTDLSKPIQHR
jgi:hypothetical protein